MGLHCRAVLISGSFAGGAMNGYQLTFYTERNRRHRHQEVCDWLLAEARRLGVKGATVIDCAEGTGHAGAHHAAHGFRVADQPVQIVLAVTADEAGRLLALVAAEGVHAFYTKVPVEFGVIGGAPAGEHRLFPLRKWGVTSSAARRV
jgi:PII-like signaling protein